jgi:ubiquinone/menaquinone biosynthesis C-methylase UbiE
MPDKEDALSRSDLQAQITAAKAYEEFFVPALFGEWAPRVAAAARIRTGDHVLDVACGTGVLARQAASQVGPSGFVAGGDAGPCMLKVAKTVAPLIEWREAQAEALPYPDQRFDAVVSQFGLMFFSDRRRALTEMQRGLKRGGRLAVAVWASLDRSPAGMARFPSIRLMVEADLRGWLPLMGVVLTEEQINRVLQEAEHVLRAHVAATGTVACEIEAHLVTGTGS